MSGSRHIGFFADARDLIAAIRECRARGIPIADVVTPFPIHGLDEELGLRRSRLPWVTLIGGAVGLAVGLWFQYWAAWTDWPLNVGGKPLDSLPAFVPVAFETTILVGGLATVAALFFRSRMWPRRTAADGLEATTDAACALILSQADASFREEDFHELLLRHGAHEQRFQQGGPE